jgi:hypothetical protein
MFVVVVKQWPVIGLITCCKLLKLTPDLYVIDFRLHQGYNQLIPYLPLDCIRVIFKLKPLQHTDIQYFFLIHMYFHLSNNSNKNDITFLPHDTFSLKLGVCVLVLAYLTQRVIELLSFVGWQKLYVFKKSSLNPLGQF